MPFRNSSLKKTKMLMMANNETILKLETWILFYMGK